MSESIRWGILATGMAATAFAEDLLELPGAEVVAVGSRTPERAEDFARRFAIPHAHGSWEALAGDAHVDVIYVATPHAAHHPAASTCLEAGKAVVCEKAFALDAAQARDMVALARRHRVFLMEAMWMRFHPAVRRAAELVAEGAIGAVRQLHADLGTAEPLDESSRLLDPDAGGGALLDLGVYGVSLAHLLLGRPSSVAAWAALTPGGVDQAARVVLGHDGGAVATVSCSFVADTACTASIIGARGRIELADDFTCPGSLTLLRSGRPPEAYATRADGPALGYQAREVMRCLRAGLLESPLMPLEATVEVMETLDAAREHAGVRYPHER